MFTVVIMLLRSIVATVLLAGLLSLLLRFIYPHFEDAKGSEDIALGIGIWLVAAAGGVVEGVRYRRKCKKHDVR
jgi:hypothetical protein